jgi:hypothetical protein
MATNCEWQESHQYWGGEECAVIQILPLYNIVERKYFLCCHDLVVRIPLRCDKALLIKLDFFKVVFSGQENNVYKIYI